MTESRAPYHALDLSPKKHVREPDPCSSCEEYRAAHPGLALFSRQVIERCLRPSSWGRLELARTCEACGQELYKFRKIEAMR